MTSDSPDIDGGWAIVVALCGLIVQSLSFTGSIFYAMFLDEFEESPVLTSWAINAYYFFSTAGAMIANCVFSMLGARYTIVIGCLLSTSGLIASSFVSNIVGILVLYGIVSGHGIAFVFFSIYSVMPIYFKKYRVIATAVVSIGTGVGQFITTPLVQYLEEKYHWRGALLILGGLSLNMLVAAAIIFPPRQISTGEEEEAAKKTDALDIFKSLYSGLKVFRLPIWYPFLIGRFTVSLGIGCFFTHIFNFGRLPRLGLTPSQLTFLPSMFGIGSIVARILMGVITQLPKTNVALMYMLIWSLMVISNIVITFTENYVGLAVCSFLAGMSLGGNAIVFELIIHIVGLKLYSSALGYNLLSNGLGMLLGGPLAAWIYELDPSYVWTFRALGIIVLVGVILNVPSWLTIESGSVSQRLSMDEQLKRKERSAEKLLSPQDRDEALV